jgi:hypothetical protein
MVPGCSGSTATDATELEMRLSDPVSSTVLASPT